MMDDKQDFRLVIAFLVSFALVLSTADKSKADPGEAVRPSYELLQPATENIDYTMYQRIRDEGLGHSHVMEYASALIDGIGSRLTGPQT
jgi:carboxypeptidase Q